MRVRGSGPVVAASGEGLMMPSPGRPRQGFFVIGQTKPNDGDEQTTHFRFGQRDQINGAFFSCVSDEATRITDSNASASIDKVTWRYQPCQLRTS